jgi:hypothetical protein
VIRGGQKKEQSRTIQSPKAKSQGNTFPAIAGKKKQPKTTKTEKTPTHHHTIGVQLFTPTIN